MNGHNLRVLAQAWAEVAHDGQSRRGAGEPYIRHCARVAENVWGWRAKALAWLHDTIEDSSDPLMMRAALEVLFPSDFVEDLMLLTREEYDGVKQESYQSYIERIAASGRSDVIAVKLADLDDNLSDIKDIPGAQELEARYLLARATLLGAQ